MTMMIKVMTTTMMMYTMIMILLTMLRMTYDKEESSMTTSGIFNDCRGTQFHNSDDVDKEEDVVYIDNNFDSEDDDND